MILAEDQVRYYLQRMAKSGLKESESDCAKEVNMILEKHCQTLKKKIPGRFWAHEPYSTAEIQAKLQDLRPKIEDLIYSKFRQMRKNGAIRDIRATSAEALVRVQMKSLGIEEYSIIKQRYRIKVAIPLGKTKSATFCLKYSTINEDIQKINDGYQALVKAVELLGNELVIK